MCYSRRDYGLEEEARRLREEERTRGSRREEESRARRAREREQKPLTQKAREVVGHIGRAG